MSTQISAAENVKTNFWKQSIVLGLIGRVLFGLSLRWEFLTSTSERFHFVVLSIWCVNALLNRERGASRGVSYRLNRKGAIFIGMLCGALLFFWQVASMQAQLVGGRTDWVEPLYKLSLVASCFVLYSLLSNGFNWALRLLPKTNALSEVATNRRWQLARAVICIALFAPYLFTTFNSHRFKIRNATNPQIAIQLAYESVNFVADEDRVRLSGWFIPAQTNRHSDATIVLCHGVGSNKADMLGVVPFLHRAGLNVFVFDFRGHGDSAGHTTSFGVYEARDVKGAVRYLSHQRGVNNIGTYAFSMGAAALLHAVNTLPEVRGVLVDGTFADFPNIVSSQTDFLPAPLNQMMVAATDFYGCLELGVSLKEMSSRPLVAAISPRPLLIVHGTDDPLIAPSHARANFEAARQPKELWLVKGAGHCQSYAVAKNEYEKRVARFFQKCLMPPSMD